MKLFKKLDDELHFWAGMLISFFTFFPLAFVFPQWVSALFAFGLTAATGIGKEWYDEHIKKTRFDERDFAVAHWPLVRVARVSVAHLREH